MPQKEQKLSGENIQLEQALRYYLKKMPEN